MLGLGLSLAITQTASSGGGGGATTTTVLDATKKNTALTLSNGNLTALGDFTLGAADQIARTTNPVPSGGKYYCEFHFDATANGGVPTFGCVDATYSFAVNNAGTSPGYGGNTDGANYERNNTTNPSGAAAPAYAVNDIGMACIKFNGTTARLWVGKNGTWTGDPSAETGGESISIPACYGFFGGSAGTQLTLNFGQSAFTYSKPTGATAWS